MNRERERERERYNISLFTLSILFILQGGRCLREILLILSLQPVGLTTLIYDHTIETAIQVSISVTFLVDLGEDAPCFGKITRLKAEKNHKYL